MKKRRPIWRQSCPAPQGDQDRGSAKRQAGIKVKSVAELVGKLKTAGTI